MAETLAFMAETLTGAKRDNDVFRYDEHCLSFYFPCGPAVTAAKYEKKLFALKAASYFKHPERNGILPAEFSTMTFMGDISVLSVRNKCTGTEVVL